MSLLFEIEENGFTYSFVQHPLSLTCLWIEVWQGKHLCYRKLQGIIDFQRIEWENDFFGDLAKNFPKHIQEQADQLVARIFKLKAFL